METKACKGCKKEKSTSEFRIMKRKLKNGTREYLYSYCRECELARQRARRASLTEEQKKKKSDYRKKYYQENKEREAANAKAYGPRYRAENKERISERRKQWEEKNKDRLSARRKEYYSLNRARIRSEQALYYENNKETIKENNKEYVRNLPAGIYQIKNKETGRVYIGASTKIPSRWTGHRRDLRRGQHHSKDMQQDYDTHGLESFEFEIIQEHPCDTEFSLLEKIETREIELRLAEGQDLYNTPIDERNWNRVPWNHPSRRNS